MSILYDSRLTTPEQLGERITALGYTFEVVGDSYAILPTKDDKRWQAPVPDNAPKFLRDAFEIAQQKKQPLIVDFWASWCGPCIRLKQETFADAQVAELLQRIQFVSVDLDEHPKLGDAYGVDAIPDVFLIDREGFVVDRLHNFEPAVEFAERLRQVLRNSPDKKPIVEPPAQPD